MTLKEVFSILKHLQEIRCSKDESGNARQKSDSFLSQMEKLAVAIASYHILRGGPSSRKSSKEEEVYRATKKSVVESLKHSVPRFCNDPRFDERKLRTILQSVNATYGFDLVATGTSGQFISNGGDHVRIIELENFLCQAATLVGVDTEKRFNVGVGHTLNNIHAWLMSRSIDFGERDYPTQFLLKEGSSEAIYDWYRSRQLDAAITPVSEELNQSKNAKLIGSVEFERKVLINRREAGELQARVIDWKFLAEKKVLIVEPANGLVAMCREKAPSSASVVPVDSWSEAMASVLANNNGNYCCIVCPEMLASKDRTRFVELPLGDLPSLDVGIYQFENRKGPNVPSENDISTLVKGYQKQLGSIGASRSDCAKAVEENFKYTAHLTRGSDGKPVWLRGEIFNLSMTPNGQIRADHLLRSNDKKISDEWNTLEGRVTLVDKNSICICCGFWARRSGVRALSNGYAVNLSMVDKNDFFLGSWSGAPTRYKSVPFLTGIFIAGKNSFEKWSEEDLNEAAVSWLEQNGLKNFHHVNGLFGVEVEVESPDESNSLEEDGN